MHMSNVFKNLKEKFVYRKEERVLKKYLDQAVDYLKDRGIENPSSNELYDIAEILMRRDGTDLSKIRTGDQKLPDNL